MRKVLSVFIAVCLVLSLFTGIFVSMPSARADITEGDYTYTVDGSSNATITGYTSGKGVVVIPNTLGGHPVTSIGDNVFKFNSFLTSVTIPASVTSMAFYACSALTSVIIERGVTSIGAQAFRACSALTSVIIPNSVTSIDDMAFDGCSALTSVTIPSSVTSIGFSAFAGSGLTSVTIPSGVTSIDNCAFFDCEQLTRVTIGNGVTSIGDMTVSAFGHTGVFQGCTALTSVTIPNSVTTIGNETFQGCTALTGVTIPNSVTAIGMNAFAGCSGLTRVTIGSGVTSIGIEAFYYCTELTAAHFLGNAPTGTSSMFDACAPGFTVHYVSGTTGWSNQWYGYPTTTVENTTKPPTVLVLHIGKSTFTVNGASKTLDSPPIIKNGRTLVPIRAIIEALGGTVGWDATTKKATVTLGKKTIALWIGKSAATVNGVSTPIDATDASVVPEIINSRTMLPLRFVSENLGCTVVWAAATQTITITYTP